MKMINKQRVQRIKNLIYAFIILLMFLPLILMSVLSFQMFGAIKDLNAKVDNLGKAAAVQSTGQSPAEGSAPDSGYVLEPDQQVSRPADTQDPALEPEAESEVDRALIAGEDAVMAPEDVSFGVDAGGEAALPPADGGNELGGGAPLGDGEYLGAASADASNTEVSDAEISDTNAGGTVNSGTGNQKSTEAEKELAANPGTGYGNGAPSPDHTLNPSTGS